MKEETIMNKKEFIKEVQKTSKNITGSGLTLKEAEDNLNTIIIAITNVLVAGDDINISGFGKFYTKERPTRTCRNPKTGDIVEVPASTAVGFKPSDVFKKAVQ